ncbi:MAG TPA: NAD-dependent epimerase/dehydratase family protein [Steroidobacteraceae bacterium]|nr:NAD-dependent epimerase/dehydratase family protein [Steroidobacteraceae bacterium]
MKVFVTGGTGFTGGALCAHLKSRGHDVMALVRPTSDTSYLRSLDVRLATGDLRDPASLRDGMQGVEAVFNIAAAFREAKLSDKQYHDVNVTGVRNLVDAAHAVGVRRVVHCSTIGVHGDTGKTPANEETRFAPPDYYCESKVEGELLARELFAKYNMEGSVFRPLGIYGPRDTRFLKLFRGLKRGRFVMIGDGTTLYHMTYIDDLCEGIELCATRPEARGEVFILGGSHHTTLNGLIAAVSRAVGSSGPRVRVPMWPVMTAARLCEAVCRPLGIEPPLYPRRVEFFSKDRAADISKARRLLGYAPCVDDDEGARRTAKWYADNRLL